VISLRSAVHAAFVFAAIAVAEPCRAALDVAAFDERQRQILAEIEDIEHRDGPYSPALLDALERLLVLYREGEDHAFALVVIERALQVVRANSGLHSLEQAPLLMRRLESEEALGDDAAAWKTEQELLALARRHPRDLQAVTVLRTIGDRQMEALGRVLDTNEIPPRVLLGCYYQLPSLMFEGTCPRAGSRKIVVQAMLADAGRSYAEAITVLLRNEAYASETLHELEMELVRGAQLIRERYEHEGRITGTRIRNDVSVPLVPWGAAVKYVEPWRGRVAPIIELAEWELPSAGTGSREEHFLTTPEPREAQFRTPYHRGRQSLRRLYSYGIAASSPPAARAAALVAIADWDLMFSNNARAVEGYTLAYDLLREAGDAHETRVAELFAPAVPVVLPAFEPNPLARDEARVATGYIDVAFSISQYGRARDVEIVAATNAADSAQKELVTLLRTSRFRPRLADGRFAGPSRVQVRHYLYD
jgi:hypothetical protein